MHTITINEECKSLTNNEATGKPVIVTLEKGDHLVITKKVDRELHRAALREMIADMNARQYDPTKETGKSILDEIRHRHD